MLLSPSTLLRLPAALYGAGPALRAVPVFGYSTKAGLGCACVLCLPRPSSSGSRELDGRTLPSAAPASLSTRAGWVHALCV